MTCSMDHASAVSEEALVAGNKGHTSLTRAIRFQRLDLWGVVAALLLEGVGAGEL
eukprot:CAMPEP_0198698218 /NCGR_PEP_ID=MMETSP1468-20131203/334099_1 /TAXON_ID=1461545 /ORGANISM="Mantoniella sp, Strain CCMP1436" /LENGTH=54 /DNA_ID=CAMNT_0044455157 /DNA_START=257 /DNA_END=419 /DNA_ORIENTATION=-